jgi:alpha-L-fucosidase
MTHAIGLLAALLAAPPPAGSSGAAVRGEHEVIGNAAPAELTHTTHPDARWFPEAGLGLFIHWGIASVRAMNISWPMFDRGNGAAITPNEYWAQARDFHPRHYDPDRWLAAARAAGFKYAVLTTRHHEGYAMWPSRFGDFGTRTLMGGRDLVKDYVEACRRHGLKVGLYYSPPDWYFDREFLNFTRRPGATRGPDGQPRTTQKPADEIARHRAAYAAMVKGQVEELLTRYGKIDLLWFDGRPPGLKGDDIISLERIRELQPGIVVNPRLHGHGDFKTYERTLKTDRPAEGWAEFCNTWTDHWPHVADAPFRAPGFVLGQLVTARSLHINYLLGVGPTADGEFVDGIYRNMAVVGGWMKTHGAALADITPLPDGEKASAPATAGRRTRYLFALPSFKEGGHFEADLLPQTDTTLRLEGVDRPTAVRLVGDGKRLRFHHAERVLTVELPAARRTPLVDVVRVDLPAPRGVVNRHAGP